MNVLISCPHGMCDRNAKQRECDIVSHNAATILNSLIHNSHYLQPDILRKNIDLNRKIGRNTSYRKLLNQKLSHSSLVVDVHSFPNLYLPEAGDVNFFKKQETPPDIVLLKGPLDEFNSPSHGTVELSRELYYMLKSTNINVKVISGIKVLDILNNSS